MISLIIGLGNVGKKYDGTWHNLGFEVVEKIAVGWKAKWQKTPLYMIAKKGGHKNGFATRPTTFMNRSGLAVTDLLQEYNLVPSEILVVVDDFNLPLGKIRFRKAGSDGGHNGLASIIEALDTEEFPRLRLGIGPVPDDVDAVEFVLWKIPRSEQDEINKMNSLAAEAVLFCMEHGLEAAMNKYNSN